MLRSGQMKWMVKMVTKMTISINLGYNCCEWWTLVDVRPPFCFPFQALLYCWASSRIYLCFQEKCQFISCNYDLDVDRNGIYKLETGNYINCDMTWTHNIVLKAQCWMLDLSNKQFLLISKPFNIAHLFHCLYKCNNIFSSVLPSVICIVL